MPKLLSPMEAAGMLRPGWNVFVPGLASEPIAFQQALAAEPSSCEDVTFHGALVPGINTFDYAALAPSARQEALFLSAHLESSLKRGKIDHLPLGYWHAYRHFRNQSYDLVVVHVSAVQPDGTCSLGVNSDFAEAALADARNVLAVVNQAMPATFSPRLPLDKVDFAIEADEDLPQFPADAELDTVVDAVAANAAALIDDGACIQYGIGRVPGRIVCHLVDRRHLTVHSGLITDEIIPLLRSGAISNRHPLGRRPVITNAMVGTDMLYSYAADERIAFVNVDTTHSPVSIGSLENFISINSAIEVDLLGQVNSEVVGTRSISGIGGVGDFVRGANIATCGRAIVALPSVTPKGGSRIVAGLRPGVPVSISRSDGIIVVTENGVADLRGKSVNARAEALIAVAAPQYQEELERQFFG